MPVGVSWANLADQKIGYMNRMFTEIFGYVMGDFVDIADWIERTYPFVEDRDLAWKSWGAYFSAPDLFEFSIEPMELRILCKNGEIKTILHSGVILPETGWALATFVDITERKRNELFLQAAERAARENKAIYSLLLDHSPDMIIISSFDNTSRFVSPAVTQITGFTPAEYLEIGALGSIHPEDLKGAQDGIENLKNGAVREVYSFQMLRKGGSYCWVEALAIGYSDPVTGKPAGYIATVRDVSEQRKREDALASEYRELSEVAALDELTGIANRRTFNQTLEREALRHMRSNRDVSVLLLDVDYFKQFNDLYGHIPGDECLKQIATVLQRVLRRDPDLAARFGGEEFILLLPMTHLSGAEVIARKILQAIMDLAIPHADSPYGVVTISIGVACWPPGIVLDQKLLLEQADQALYRAKDGGRNTYRLHECGPPAA
ncbi:sensor domain-containing diguanylate cyclase [Granulicella sp. dw_53]|uniref:GGDEF domain-containing protein n=1 Tax=Granulicella sp. dw_53 TaxID=2719792 RepID=UPI001BD2ECE6|nr:sensor domain-containing diguanylate cyclase [Granulicella sp. dw_53]